MLKKVFKLAQAAEVTKKEAKDLRAPLPAPLCRTAALAVEASTLPPLAQLNAATVLLGEQEVNILYEPTTET
jgi:hypothetical protein